MRVARPVSLGLFAAMIFSACAFADGGHDDNVKLSQRRATAVVAAVVAQGIAKDRMISAGHCPDSLIDNNKPEGRAKNRRVELVKS